MKKRILSLVLCLLMVLASIPVYADANTVLVGSASDLPNEIAADTTYELTADITLSSGQQIETLAGVLDGKGHTITLVDQPLANNVSGTIQNLGVKSNGTITVSGVTGSMAKTLSGTIQNCFSLVNLTTSGWDDVGGLVGTLSGGNIYNSYYAGSNSAKFADGLVGEATGGAISNSFYTAGYSAVGMHGNKVSQTNVAKKSADEMKQAAIVTALNTSIVSTGYKWAVDTESKNSSFPVLAVDTGEVIIDKTVLKTDINTAKQLTEADYTTESWAVFASALAEAEIILAKEDATQTEIDKVVDALETAMGALKKPLPTEAVAAPEDESLIVHISTRAELEAIGAGNKDKYYVLDNDITLGDFWYPLDTFNGVFDGNGHTITFVNDYNGLFYGIGEAGVVQNVHFAGSLRSTAGAAAVEVKGAVINCYSEITGDGSGGLAVRLNGGVISNCYSISTAGKGPVIAYTAANGIAYTGTLQNVYWQSDLSHSSSVDLSALTVIGGGAVSESAMKTLDFVDTLNENKGTNGISWGQSSNGYPYFGENQEYVKPGDNLPENSTVIAFTFNDATEATIIENQTLTIDRNKADAWGIVGTFSLPEYEIPEGSTIEWDTPDVDMNLMDIHMDFGELFAYKDGEGVVTATLVNADSSRELLASVKVTTYIKEIEDIKLYLADDDGSNAVEIQAGKATVDGSEYKRVMIKAKYTDESIYQTISTSDFTFTVTDPDGVVKHTENPSIFRFTAPGTAIMTVAHSSNESLTKSVELTSGYVAVESVKPGLSGTVVIHGRNANSSDQSNFLPNYENVIIDPENASYAGSYKITSSDTSIGEYVESMVVGYVPYKAGTVTYTAVIDDNGTIKSGTSEVTYVYQNPLKSVSIENDEITLKMGESAIADITFTGTQDDDGYEVTETGMIWSFDKEGIISIVRGNGAFKRDDTAPDNGQFFLSEEYKIKALSAGTVTVTGTPVDTTAGAAPITFTVTVTANSDLEEADIWEIISDGIAASSDYLVNDMENSPVGMVYGYEWHIITLLRAGKDIDENLLDEYYDSVVKEIKTWDGTEKPTDIERTALALAVMGKDITNVDGVNLAEMIYNSSKLENGSNELAFALLALDALDTEIPATAAWDRDSMIEALLTFQDPETGAFGISDSASADLDMTAMCMQALAPYKEENEDVAEAIDKALSYLKDQLSGEYDYGDSCATAQVLLALAVLDIDITDASQGFGNVYENIITRLDEYRTDNGFRWMIDSDSSKTPATYQVMQAFDAYRKAMKEELSYWDFGTAGKDYTDDETTPDPEPEDPSTAADPIDVYVTISTAENVVVMQQSVEVLDRNEDGQMDVDEVLYAAHAAFYPEGAEAGYENAMSSWGLSITKLWGDNSGSFGYWLNNASCWSLSDVVEDGDYLTAFVYQDQSGWTDSYSFFENNNYKVVAGSALSVVLEVAGYDADWNRIYTGYEGASINVYMDSKVVDTDKYTVTDKGNGTYEVIFAEAGTYYLVAKSESDILVPAVCKVICTADIKTPDDETSPVTPDNNTGNNTADNNVSNNTANATTNSATIKTGDSAPIITLVIMILAAGVVVCVVMKKKRKNA